MMTGSQISLGLPIWLSYCNLDSLHSTDYDKLI